MRPLTSRAFTRFSHVRAYNHALGIGFAMVVAGCSGGGCSSGCSGSSVIPGGFPKDQRVSNAAGVRLTRPGITFLEQNLETRTVMQQLLGADLAKKLRAPSPA